MCLVYEDYDREYGFGKIDVWFKVNWELKNKFEKKNDEMKMRLIFEEGGKGGDKQECPVAKAVLETLNCSIMATIPMLW